MVGADEVWQYFHEPLALRYRGRTWFGLDELDRKLSEYIVSPQGIFVEVGAFDGLNQINTLWLERKGWQGLLIEAVPEFAQACQRNRPLSRVVNAACVAPGQDHGEVTIHQVGLMSLVDGARAAEDQKLWIQRGEEVQQISHTHCSAPARTLSSILDEQRIARIDLLSLDVEGFERQVLAGLDFGRHKPEWLLVEDSNSGELQAHVEDLGYILKTVLNERAFTRDLLFRRTAAVPG
jgi:FkbM family methyltransferase